MAETELSKIPGKKIRMQYFNGWLWSYLLLVMIVLLSMTGACLLRRGTATEWGDLWKLICTAAPWMAFFAFPLVVASLCNRFLFGKMVCVVNETGIYALQGTQVQKIRWEEITCVEYGIRFPFYRWHRSWEERFSFACVICKDRTYKILHAPFLLIHEAKKAHRGLAWHLEKKAKQRGMLALIGGLIFICLSSMLLAL